MNVRVQKLPRRPPIAEPVTKKRLPGRPRDAEKRDAIVNAARASFFEHGFGATTLEGVARHAAVSKVTVYKHFGTKEMLFAECVAAECVTMRKLLDLDSITAENLREQLVRYGEAMIAFLARPELVRFENMLGAEVERNPVLGHIFLQSGPEPMLRALAALLTRATEDGQMAINDPMLAAELLAGMFKGFSDLRRRFLGRDHCDKQALERVRTAVNIFLDAYRTRDASC
ncbi:MAG: TetR/AcrR family transcriptional regulator [Sphingomonadaceae bacterium]